jgi:hypothetical protein
MIQKQFAKATVSQNLPQFWQAVNRLTTLQAMLTSSVSAATVDIPGTKCYTVQRTRELHSFTDEKGHWL